MYDPYKRVPGKVVRREEGVHASATMMLVLFICPIKKMVIEKNKGLVGSRNLNKNMVGTYIMIVIP